MKALRLFLIGLGVMALVAAVAASVVFSAWFQTWAARVALASLPALHGSVGSVAAGTSSVHLTDLHIERAGAVLSVPTLDADLPWLSAVVSRSVDAERVVAHGWTLDLTRVSAGGLPAAVPEGAAPAAVAVAFAGLFQELDMPLDVALQGVDLEGRVLLPPTPG